MYANEDETKEKLPEIKNELRHMRCEKTITIIIINSAVIIIIIITIIAMIIYAAISSE